MSQGNNNSGPRAVTVRDGLFSNSSAVAVESFISPWTESTIRTTIQPRMVNHSVSKNAPLEWSVPTTRTVKTIKVNPTFKLIFLTVVGITILAGAVEVLLAGVWTAPSPNQQSAFEAMGFAWKAGIGAIFGLLSGKTS
jgi:hypothetical protein